MRITAISEESGARRLTASRRLDSSRTVRVEFTVITDSASESASSTSDIAAALQKTVFDGTFVQSVNADTALEFQHAELGGTQKKDAVGAVNWQAAFVVVLVIMIVLFIAVLVLIVMIKRGNGGDKAGSPQSGGVTDNEISNAGVGADQGGAGGVDMNSNPAFAHRQR